MVIAIAMIESALQGAGTNLAAVPEERPRTGMHQRRHYFGLLSAIDPSPYPDEDGSDGNRSETPSDWQCEALKKRAFSVWIGSDFPEMRTEAYMAVLRTRPLKDSIVLQNTKLEELVRIWSMKNKEKISSSKGKPYTIYEMSAGDVVTMKAVNASSFASMLPSAPTITSK
ncbi:unnamed protein product [Symbiodinium microadriaticum]|nr:unnamed protein product [Symbiodinium microadriaticum]